MSGKAKVLVIDRHERKRMQISAALDEAGHKVIDFAASTVVAHTIIEALDPSQIDIVLLGDVEFGEQRELAQARLLREIRNRGIGRAVLGISYNARSFKDIPNFPMLGEEDTSDLAGHITELSLQTTLQ